MGPSWHRDSFDIDAVLAIVGVERDKPGLESLERLTRVHLETFPIANVDILPGSHPDVEPAKFQRQMVDCGRGGYCFEHAQLFASVAEEPGFTVCRQLGRVHSPYNTRTHLTLPVLTEGAWFLTDPGFGFSIRGPLFLAARSAQERPRTRLRNRPRQRGRGGSLVAPPGRRTAARHGWFEGPTRRCAVRTPHHLDPYRRRTVHPSVDRLPIDRRWPRVTVTSGRRAARRYGQPTIHQSITTAEAVEGAGELAVS